NKKVDALVSKIQTLGAALLSGAAIKGLVSFVDQNREMTEALRVGGLRVGISAGEMQILGTVAQGAGLQIQDVTDAVGNLQKGADDGSLSDVFRDLGIEVRDANGHVRGAMGLFRDSSDAIAGLENSATRTAIAMRLF